VKRETPRYRIYALFTGDRIAGQRRSLPVADEMVRFDRHNPGPSQA
jgi:hypothetical protein